MALSKDSRILHHLFCKSFDLLRFKVASFSFVASNCNKAMNIRKFGNRLLYLERRIVCFAIVMANTAILLCKSICGKNHFFAFILKDMLAFVFNQMRMSLINC